MVTDQHEPSPATPADADLRLTLMQARYVLRDLHHKDANCGYGKLAGACETAATELQSLREKLRVADDELKRTRMVKEDHFRNVKRLSKRVAELEIDLATIRSADNG